MDQQLNCVFEFRYLLWEMGTVKKRLKNSGWENCKKKQRITSKASAIFDGYF